jgi:SAM-dependent methyltransferase
MSRPLPDRYFDSWVGRFEALFAPDLVPGVSILDVGSGRRPALAPGARPRGCRYVGLDVSLDELRAAPADAYDEIVVGDVGQRMRELDDQFDVVISWQVLEHVRSLSSALDNMRQYLHPGGRLVAQLSGRYALFALVARVLPHRIGARAMEKLLDREPETVFHAWYDDCSYTRLARLLEPWSSWEILPCYLGASYLSFAELLQRAYLTYEDWALRHGHRNLATHYLVSARR